MKSNQQKFSFLTKTLSVVLLYSFIFTNIFAVRIFADTTAENAVKSPTLTKYTTDLTELARQNRLRVNANFADETTRLIKMLTSGGLQQPVILDEKGENQELVVEPLALRITTNDVPANLRGKRLLKLETASLFSNAKNEAQTSQIIESGQRKKSKASRHLRGGITKNTACYRLTNLLRWRKKSVRLTRSADRF